ncbi:MAG: ATP-binding protein [Candidatus Hodarchaeales archaeon]
MKITKTTTSYINFLMDVNNHIIHERDYLILFDQNKHTNKHLLAQVNRLTQEKENEMKGTANILGEFEMDEFRLFPCRIPVSMDSEISIPPRGLISKIISYDGEEGIYLGDIITSPNSTDPFLISPQFLERHVLCVASTGAGKSYSIGVLLEEILLKFKNASVLLFDVHNEYWGLGLENPGQETASLDRAGYTPQGFSEQILVFEKDSIGLGAYFDLPKLRRLLEISAAQDNALINILQEPENLEDILTKLQTADIHTGTRENLISKINTLFKQFVYTEELDIPSLVRENQVSIIRLDQYTDEKKRNTLVTELLTQIFQKKVQGEIPNEQEILIILEEAHRFAQTSGILARIAREGRKFGIYEILISQRPGDLPDNIIANMNTLVALRIKSEKDITKIRLMEGINSDTVSVLPHLTKGEALIVGLQDGISSPIKIKIRSRLTKHVDPQKDVMPESIPRYPEINHFKELEESVEDLTLDTSTDEKDSISLQLTMKPIDHKDLVNLLYCEHIMITHKLTGICLYKYGTSMLKVDPQLVSGFLTAISSLFTELKSEEIKDRTIVRDFSEEIGDRTFKIITFEGNFSVTALILERPPKFGKRLRKRGREFVYAFEKKFNKHLSNFIGELDPFQEVIEDLDQYFGLSLLGPLTIKIDDEKHVVDDQLLQVIQEQSNQLANTEGLFIKEIVNHGFFSSKFKYIEIFEQLLNLFREKVLVPQDFNRRLPILNGESLSKDDEIPIDGTLLSQEQEIDELSKGSTQHTGIIDEWVTQMVSEIHDNSLPDQLKEDILVRDIIFESNIKLKDSTPNISIYSETELVKSLDLLSRAGFMINKKGVNPLRGPKYIISTERANLIVSISMYKEDTYLCVIAQLE